MNAKLKKMQSLLKTPEMMDWLRVSRHELGRLIAEDGLPVIKLGYRTLRFDPDAVRGWLDKRQSSEGVRERLSVRFGQLV